jgi:hypothetical protein
VNHLRETRVDDYYDIKNVLTQLEWISVNVSDSRWDPVTFLLKGKISTFLHKKWVP